MSGVLQWEALLADVDIVAFTGPKQAVEVLGILAGKDSPLKKLLVAVARETRLEHADASKKEGVAEAADALSAVKDRLARLLQTQPAGPTEPQAAPRGNPVDERFAPLHRLVEGEAGGPAPIDATLAQLDELYVQLNSIASALDRGGTALEAAGRQAGMGGAVGQVRAQAQRQPAPLNEWLQAVGSRP
jgi:type VI secretion system protein ImpL